MIISHEHTLRSPELTKVIPFAVPEADRGDACQDIPLSVKKLRYAEKNGPPAVDNLKYYDSGMSTTSINYRVKFWTFRCFNLIMDNPHIRAACEESAQLARDENYDTEVYQPSQPTFWTNQCPVGSSLLMIAQELDRDCWIASVLHRTAWNYELYVIAKNNVPYVLYKSDVETEGNKIINYVTHMTWHFNDEIFFYSTVSSDHNEPHVHLTWGYW